MRATNVVLLAVLGLGVAGCSSGPGKIVQVDDILHFSPASVSSDDPTLQVCVLPARRCATLEDVPGGRTALVVNLTKVDGTKGDKTYSTATGIPATFSVRGPWVLTLHDGFLRVDAVKGSRGVRATVEGAQAPAPPPLVSEEEIWVWIGRPPTEDDPDPRGTFVGVRQAR